jgi:HPt (histidine-containing phosphotransfer) domain-containing protein
LHLVSTGSPPPCQDPGATDRTRSTVLDPGAIDNIRALQKPGKPNLLAKIVRFYLSDASRLLQVMREAITAADSNALRDAAHTMKSSSANLGALDLAQVCKEIEVEARAGSTAHAAVNLVRMEHEFELVAVELRGHIEGKWNERDVGT